MLQMLYKRIIKKLCLSQNKLEILRGKLSIDNVCVGPFQDNNMMCPNTNALAIKHNIDHFSNNTEIRKYFHQNGVTNVELWMFYILFDMPAKLSKSYTEKSLSVFRTAVDKLISEK